VTLTGRASDDNSAGGGQRPVMAYPMGAAKFELVGSKNSNLLNDPDFTTEMLAD